MSDGVSPTTVTVACSPSRWRATSMPCWKISARDSRGKENDPNANTGLNAQDIAYGVAEGKVMDSVSAIEQRAVNIEKEGIGAVPAEPGAHERSSSGRIWSQVCHLELD